MALGDQLMGHVGDDRHRLLDEDSSLRADVSGPIPTEEELAQTYVAPGSKAQLPIGILYQAAWKDEADGMARHARNQVRALATTGLPLRLQSFGQHVVINDDLAESVRKVSYLEGVSFTVTALSIKQLVIGTPGLLREVICPAAIRSLHPEAVEKIAERTIIYTSWERDRVHPQYVEMLNTVGEVWVPCQANRGAFIDSGLNPEKVCVVPFPYDPEETIAAPRGPETVPDGKRFYSIAKWEPRKNQHRLIGAFLLAFTPKDRASLLIKTSGYGYGWADYPEPDESITHWLADERVKKNGWNEQQVDRLIRIVSKKVSAEDLNRIHLTNNIYVSAGLGEAWDLPAFDARLAGNRLVYVGYGGPEEYAAVQDVKAPWFNLVPVHPGYLWESDARWAEVTAEQLAAAMQGVEPPTARMVPPELYQQYSLQAVGRLMESRIQRLTESQGTWSLLKQAGGFG